MTKRRIREISIPTEVDHPDIKLRYDEGDPNKWLKRNRTGFLEIEVSYLKRGNHEVFRLKFDPAEKRLDDSDLEKISLEALDYLDLATKRDLPKDVLSGIKSQVIESVSLATRRMGFLDRYIESGVERAKIKKREVEERADAETHRQERELEERVRELSEKTRRRIVNVEGKFLYESATRVSFDNGLEYNLSRADIDRRTNSLFSRDDNLESRPLFGHSVKPGEWAQFIKKLVSPGFYSGLQAVERDLDEFYISIAEEVQKRIGDKDINDTELETIYEAVIREKYTKEEVTFLFERHKKAEINLFEKLIGKSKDNPTDYKRATELIKRGLGFNGGLVTAVSPKIPPFIASEIPEDNTRAEFERVMARVNSLFSEYLTNNDKNLRCPTAEQPDGYGINYEVMVISDRTGDAHAQSGSLGLVLPDNRGFRYNDKPIAFSFITGKSRELPYQVNIPTQFLRKAKSPSDRYSGLGAAAEEIINAARKDALDTATDKQIIADQKTIAGFYPHLDQMVTFIEGMHKKYLERIERIYAKPDPAVEP